MLNVNGISHVYPNGTRALDAVTLTVPRGVCGLLGPNGAGKSTLMRILATLQTPTEGAVRFRETDVLAKPQQLRQTLGYLPQEFGVYPRLSAWELLNHLAVLKGVAPAAERREMVEAMLQHVNLWEVRKKAVARFSGGMRQRFGIAQALLGDPGLVIVDEPTAGLDPEERNRILDLLVEVGDRAVVLLSTHIVEDVSDVCGRMAVISGGRVLVEGKPADLISRLRERVWTKSIARSDLDSCRQRHELISTRLLFGRVVVHVVSESDPGDGFALAKASLDDVYFAALAGSRGSA
ncbi:MAG: ABC transporter ATP-binding protein [Acidobacteria bacterium]|nr:ABC transporter ATP-binding protein [Acidobacteriota bacterium]